MVLLQTIKDRLQYELYMAEVEKLMCLDPEPDSIEGQYFNSLVDLIIEYEKKNFLLKKPSFATRIVTRIKNLFR